MINVRSTWDTGGVRAYATEVRNAIRQIEAAASGVRGTPTPHAQVQTNVQAAQAQAEAGLSSIARAGILPPQAMEQLAHAVRADFERLARVLEVELAGAEQAEAQAKRVNESSLKASNAQLRADRNREERANKEAAQVGTAAAAGRAPVTREERVARAAETALIQREGRRQGAAEDARRLAANEGGALDTKLAAAADRELVRQAERAVVAAVGAEAATQKEIVEAARLQLLARREAAGAVSRSILRRPGDVDTLTTANVSTRALGDTVRGQTVAREAALLEDRDPARVGQHGLRVEEIANRAVRTAQEQAAADGLLLNSTKALREKKVAREALNAATQTPAQLEAAEKRRAAAETAAARRTEADSRRQAKADADLVLATERDARAAERAAVRGSTTPSFVQNLQARLHARPGEPPPDPLDYGTGRQLLGTGLLTSARFAASGALLYGVLTTVQQMVRQASILEQTFNQIEAQFTSLGQGGDVAGFKRAIFDIAAATGEQADEVARVAFQMKGAFGDTTLAIDQTTAAIEIARVTGLSLVEVVDSLTAASKSFGIPIRALGDEALAVQERFGVLAKETLTAFGDVGVVAAQAGLNVHELGGILGGLQQIAGRSGSALAEAIGRVLPAIQESSTEILNLYQTVPKLQGNFPKIRDLLGQGAYGQVLLQVTRDYKDLDATQQAYFIHQLGGRREAQTLIGIFRQYGLILDYIDHQTDTAGKQIEYFNKLQETLSQRVARLRREFEQFGQELFNAGLGDVLKDLASGGADVAHVAGLVAEGFAKANEATHGLALRLLELYAAYRLLLALRGLGTVTGGIGGVLGSGVRAGTGLADRAAFGLYDAGGRYDAARAASAASTSAAGYTRAGTAVAGAASGTLGALGLNPVNLTALAALVVGSKYSSEQGKLRTQAQALRKQIEDYDKAQLQKLLKDHSDTWDWLAGAIGLPTVSGEIKHEQAQDRFDAIKVRAKAAVDLGLIKSGGGAATREEKIGTILRRAGEGNKAEVKYLEDELARIEGDPALRGRLDTKVAGDADVARKKLEEAKEKDRLTTTAVVEGVKEVQTRYEAGLASVGEYAKALDDQIAKLEASLPGLTGDQLTAARENIATLRADQAGLPSKLAKGLADYKISQIDLSGGGAADKIPVLTALLKDPKFTDPTKRADAAKQLVSLEQEILRERVARATTAEEQVRILTQGVDIDPTARVETLIQTIQSYDITFTKYLETVAGGADQAAKLLRQAVERAIDRSITVGQAVNEIINAEVTRLRGELAKLGGGSAVGSLDDPGKNQALHDALDKELAKLTVPNPGSIVQAPAARVKGDASQIKAAKDKAREEAIANQQARFALAKAIAEGDPVEQARIAIEEAQFLIANARTTAEKLNAQAQLVSAQHQLADAQSQVSDAYRAIDTAMAAAAGDTVRVAQNELDLAREHIDRAHKRGDVLGEAAARADAIAKQANVVAAQLNVGQQQTDFLLAMEQITTGQAITQLEGLLKIPGITQEQTQQLLLKIHQLRKDASKDLQFDIPSEIKLPTLYEVRRLRQSEAQGMGYQDNRQINVQYNVMTAQDNQAALDDLLAVTSGQPRVGATPKGY